ncbi:MAG: DUF3570 domain-containing protein [Myxococcota bacterium]|nr:DUF3570 domain-containing protein [Myxococcota bacterium]
MQLRRLSLLAAFAAITANGKPASAQVVQLDTGHAFFYEAPTRTHMFVYSPSVGVQASPWSWLDVRGGWEADVVSGASVATKAGAIYGGAHAADVVTTASVRDVRNLGQGELLFKGDATTLTAGYAYGTERDYQSSSLHVKASTDVLQHNTQFELSYARNFDALCDRVQSASAASATQWLALEDSKGCFTAAANRMTHPIGIDTYEASWAQSWTPVFATQLTYGAQLVNGFQSDPYRSVILGEGLKAQEHEPNERARESVTARLAWYVRALKAALRVSVRAYHDTWAIDSGSLEAEAERSFGESLRLMLRGRVYKQTGAIFWSDDYTGGRPPLGPRGQYWTGDRELSPFWSWLTGARAVWTIAPPNRRAAGPIRTLKLAATLAMSSYSYDEYTLGGAPVSNARTYLGALTLDALF